MHAEFDFKVAKAGAVLIAAHETVDFALVQSPLALTWLRWPYGIAFRALCARTSGNRWVRKLREKAHSETFGNGGSCFGQGPPFLVTLL